MATQTTQIVKRPIDTIRALLEKSKNQIALALPKHLSAERIVRLTLTTIQRNPDLLDCDPISLVGAVIQSSQLGLEPDGILGHAYLVPFRNNKKGGKMEVQFIPGYKGLIDLARRSGQVNRISAHIVYEGDVFKMEFGTSEVLEHIPVPPSQRGERKGCYAVAVLKDGSTHFEWLWEEEIQKVKNQSKASKFGPWVTHEDEMIRKTAIRRLVKYLPLSVELAKASAIDELAEEGISTQEYMDDEAFIPPTQPKTIDAAFQETANTKTEVLEQPKTVVEMPQNVSQPVENVKKAEVKETVPAPQPQNIGWFWCENKECVNPVPIDKNVTINTAMCPNCHQPTLHESKDNSRAGAANERMKFVTNQTAEPQKVKGEKDILIDQILSYDLKPSMLTVYVLKSIGTNRNINDLSSDEARKVLNYIQSIKGANQ
jgi:recombination protein RecT